MKTNQNMIRRIGEFEVYQRTKDQKGVEKYKTDYQVVTIIKGENLNTNEIVLTTKVKNIYRPYLLSSGGICEREVRSFSFTYNKSCMGFDTEITVTT